VSTAADRKSQPLEFENLVLTESQRGLWYRFTRHRLSLLGIAIVAVFTIGAVFAPWIGVHNPDAVDLDHIKNAPTLSHIMGTDSVGRDVFSRLLHGSRITLGIALVALLIAVGIGTLIGLISGFLRGWVDNVLMRFTELVMTFPILFALIILVAVFGGSIVNITIAIGFLGWMGIARLVRGQTLAVREMEFVTAARALGASDRRVIFLHILPEIMPYVAVAGTLGLASAILIEAALNFLGLGVQIPTATWGNMMTAAQSLHVLKKQPWLWLPPGVAISMTVLAVNFIGEGLRDALDPRIQID
jgi:peptide/nickel transport system permease protein